MMEKLIERLSTYNIFTNLVPGAIYCFLADKFFDTDFVQENLVTAFFFYYFCGTTISRIGSLVLEPSLRKIKFVKFAPYSDYLVAAANDKKIETLQEVSNTYRSLASLLLCVLATGLLKDAQSAMNISDICARYILIFSLLALFLIAHKKQTKFIAARVHIKKSHSEKSP